MLALSYTINYTNNNQLYKLDNSGKIDTVYLLVHTAKFAILSNMCDFKFRPRYITIQVDI